jgi:EAL domain-containing protein (putative c-di-GMP-specific phosphodiesterase class I)
VRTELQALKAEGVIITIDDFGAGYSNLARLRSMPVDRVKLDGTLVDDVDTSEDSRTIVSAVVHLAHGLGLQVVAKSVERQAQIEILRAMGCDALQGYALAEPMDEQGFVAWAADYERKMALSA